ncbi:hypothetical protein FJR45_01005 [Sulfurimonas sediminis]|uniref:Uncharacterized protein n=1 Tax=Sulfurimonas sediminis TaxID=2590020 RepID=A0A7M1AYP6_9BACT|nr:hypothetical protein [Sulfurimonas sediminis]QOP42609.1 hypothetical protein FJR45_01005 [Sulfurimonas sediminis]
MWHTKLQIAIIEKNAEEIDKLVSQMPKFETIEQMKSAASLIKEALKIVKQLKSETGKTLKKLRQHQEFLGTTSLMTHNKFDIIS